MHQSHLSIRENNTNLVLSEIINNTNISRARIAEITGLNKATVSDIVKQLIKDHYVIEIGSGESTPSGGRKPILLTVNKRAGVSFSFDVRYDQLSYLITYLDGEVIKYHFIETELSKENVVELISSIVKDFQSELKRSPFGIIGIAISIHGIVHQNKLTLTPYFDLDEINLVKQLEKKLSLPVQLENEANLSALAEAAFDKVHTHIISFSVHTGIGAGIIIDHQLHRGNKGRSGEIGHTILYPDGLPCPCGNKGCFEQYCSYAALLRRYKDIKTDPKSTIEDLMQDLKNDELKTKKMISKFSKDMAIGLMNIIGTYDPEIVYINSEILEKIPSMIEMLNEELSRTIYKDVQIRQSKLGNKSSLYGATVLNLRNFLNVESIVF